MISDALVTTLVAVGVTLLALAGMRTARSFEARVLRVMGLVWTRPRLRATPSFLLVAFVSIVTFWLFSPATGVIVTIATVALVVALRTVVVDIALLHASRVARLRGRTARAEALARAGARLLGRHLGAPPVALFAVAYAQVLDSMASPAKAEALLARFESERYPLDILEWGIAFNLAHYRIRLHRFDDARATLEARVARWPVPRTDHHESTYAHYVARIDISTGKAAAVLDRIAGETSTEWEMLRAHAFAVEGRVLEARAALERVRARDGGEALLTAVAEYRGPAAPIAQEMLEVPPTPYR